MWDISRLGRQGYDPDELPTIRLLAGHKSSGEPVYEQTSAVEVDTDVWRLMTTPGVVEGVASGDVVRLLTDGRVELVERGGNVAVKLYTRQEEPILRALVAEAEQHGAWLDGYLPHRLVVLTFPASVGFAGVEAVLNRFVATHPDDSWCYDNVYDAEDQPLNWWA